MTATAAALAGRSPAAARALRVALAARRGKLVRITLGDRAAPGPRHAASASRVDAPDQHGRSGSTTNQPPWLAAARLPRLAQDDHAGASVGRVRVGDPSDREHGGDVDMLDEAAARNRSPACSRISSGWPIWTISPSFMSTMRPPRLIASSRSCETNTTVLRRFRLQLPQLLPACRGGSEDRAR